jgi:hypothetical protein
MITAALGALYVTIAPPTADLAAASYRSYLFAHHGLSVWDGSWYGGHYLPAYSLLSPALGALLSPTLLAALGATAAAALFGAVVKLYFSERGARVGGIWFAAGAGAELFSGRVTFELGLALALGSLLAAVRGRRAGSLALALATPLASPVAGAFLALAGLADALTGFPRRGLALAASALAPILLLALAFPEGGWEPFVASSFWPALALVLLLAWLLGPVKPALRAGALLYGAALIGAFALHTPVGGNAVRLGALMAGPLAACALIGRRGRVLLVLSPALLYWQLIAPVRDLASGASDPAVQASYYTPLIERLGALGALGSPTRIEVLPTRDHWEARILAPYVSLARGWERQLDERYDSIFYRSSLSAAAYLAWLRENAVAYVALPSAPLDHSARSEDRLIHSNPSFLREVWRSAHWRLFAVSPATPLAAPPAVLRALGTDSFTVYAPRAGIYEVRVHYTPYWHSRQALACVSRAPDGWTRVRVASAGQVAVGIEFSLRRLLQGSPRCQ